MSADKDIAALIFGEPRIMSELIQELEELKNEIINFTTKDEDPVKETKLPYIEKAFKYTLFF